MYACACSMYISGVYSYTQSDFSDRAPARVETYYDSKSDFSLYILYSRQPCMPRDAASF